MAGPRPAPPYADHLDRIHAPELARKALRRSYVAPQAAATAAHFATVYPGNLLRTLVARDSASRMCVCSEERATALRCVLRHELTHVARRDALGQLLFNLAFPLFYFHPLYWWLRSRVHLAAELIADDRAVDGEAKPCYVQALIDLARRRAAACVSEFAGSFRFPFSIL